MSTTITIAITVGDEGYTAREQAIIASLQAHPSQGAAAVVPASKPAPAAAPKAAAPAASKPAPKAEKPAPAPASAQSNTPAVLDTTLDEPVEVEEDLVGGGTQYTVADAVAEATKLVSQQKQAKVKEALAAVGAKRVSELKADEDIQKFMAALQA